MSSPRPLTCVSPASAGGERTLSGCRGWHAALFVSVFPYSLWPLRAQIQLSLILDTCTQVTDVFAE